MGESAAFRLHGLTGTTKRRVFDALFQQQDGKCFICGISQAALEARGRACLEEWRKIAEACSIDDPYYQWYQAKLTRGVASVHGMLHIDHCHMTGAIRGLLCPDCNYHLGDVENSGLLQHYLTPAYQYEPLDFHQARLEKWLRWNCDDWLNKHRDIILLYMQPERWLPRKDILFHLELTVSID